jgi:hypothetical protein
MSDASLTPRVRSLLVCDDVIASEVENGVFTLEGVRQQVTADTFPWKVQLNLFLLLSSARKGTYQGKVVLVHDETNKSARYVKFRAKFGEDNEILPLYVGLGWCPFAEAGQYTLQVFFAPPEGSDVLKGELPFVVSNEE